MRGEGQGRRPAPGAGSLEGLVQSSGLPSCLRGQPGWGASTCLSGEEGWGQEVGRGAWTVDGLLTWAGPPCRGAGLVWDREPGSWDGQQAGGEGVKGQSSL